METKELNLLKILKGCEGKTFYSLNLGEVKYISCNGDTLYFINDEIAEPTLTSSSGQCRYGNYGVCTIFPSRALYEQYPLDPYTAWMMWQEEQKSPFICIHWGEVDCYGDAEEDYMSNAYFRTHSDRDKCIEEIKTIIEKYSR